MREADLVVIIPVCHTTNPGSIPHADKMFFVFYFKLISSYLLFFFQQIYVCILPKLYMFLQAKKLLRYLVKILKALSCEWTRGRCISHFGLKTIMESFRDRNMHDGMGTKKL
jgi:hypothetical protein